MHRQGTQAPNCTDKEHNNDNRKVTQWHRYTMLQVPEQQESTHPTNICLILCLHASHQPEAYPRRPQRPSCWPSDRCQVQLVAIATMQPQVGSGTIPTHCTEPSRHVAAGPPGHVSICRTTPKHPQRLLSLHPAKPPDSQMPTPQARCKLACRQLKGAIQSCRKVSTAVRRPCSISAPLNHCHSKPPNHGAQQHGCRISKGS